MCCVVCGEVDHHDASSCIRGIIVYLCAHHSYVKKNM